ncbi:hypothetical protein EVAR_71935_1 [Eumeta japonica]|uniref:Uncharacterized protein n=1 Tax=Eumeta variegata TaxID=151549 RepID=A0A4C1SW39_EUMVA|nr:hypothetical protein EVAR_71935_1 [Eumeta japonica]
MQTFKQTTPPRTQEKPAVMPPSPSSEIRFKIQTYESKTQTSKNPPLIFQDHEEHLPSLFELQRRNSPPTERKQTKLHIINIDFKRVFPPTPNEIYLRILLPKHALTDDDLDHYNTTTLVVGKYENRRHFYAFILFQFE